MIVYIPTDHNGRLMRWRHEPGYLRGVGQLCYCATDFTPRPVRSLEAVRRQIRLTEEYRQRFGCFNPDVDRYDWVAVDVAAFAPLVDRMRAQQRARRRRTVARGTLTRSMIGRAR